MKQFLLLVLVLSLFRSQGFAQDFASPVAVGLWPSDSAHTPGAVEVFALDSNTRSMMHRWQINPPPSVQFSSWQSLGSDTNFNSEPSVIVDCANNPNNLEVFCIKEDGNCYHNWFGSDWSGWLNLGGNNLNSNISVITHGGPNGICVEAFGVDRSGNVRNNWFDPSVGWTFNTSGQVWNCLGGNVATWYQGEGFISALDSTIPGKELFAVSGTNVCNNWYENGNWAFNCAAWTNSLGGSPQITTVASAMDSQGQKIIFDGTSSGIFYDYYKAGNWGGWTSMNSPAQSVFTHQCTVLFTSSYHSGCLALFAGVNDKNHNVQVCLQNSPGGSFGAWSSLPPLPNGGVGNAVYPSVGFLSDGEIIVWVFTGAGGPVYWMDGNQTSTGINWSTSWAS